MDPKKILVALIVLLAGCSNGSRENQRTFIEIVGSETNRPYSIVSAEFQSSKTFSHVDLIDDEGDVIPVQVSESEITFLIQNLHAGEKRRFEIVPKSPGQKTMNIRFGKDAVQFLSKKNRPVLQYRAGKGGIAPDAADDVFLRGGYIHPLYTPQGKILTEEYTGGRPHQNGIWTGWYKTEWNGIKPDFWSAAEKTGVIEVQTVGSLEAGQLYSELKSTHHFKEIITDDSMAILSDQWVVRAYDTIEKPEHEMNIADVDVRQVNITDHPFTLLEHVYGGVGFRGSDDWIGEGMMEFITSEGENRAEAHHSKARWVAMSGEIDGETASIIILAHPDNPRFPEPVFINQREPFFTFAPLQDGDLIIDPDEQFRARYRYITMDGSLPNSDEIESYWKDYANPVKAEIINQ